MKDMKNNTTGEPVEGQATTNMTADTKEANTSTTAQAPAKEATSPSPSTTPAENSAASGLPADYLDHGYYKGEGKGRYPAPELVGKLAQQVAETLASGGLKPSGFNPILRGLKKANKKTLPVEAKTGALSGAIVKAKLLEQRRRAPHALVELLERNRAAVHDAMDYEAAYQHLEAIGVYLGDQEQEVESGLTE